MTKPWAINLGSTYLAALAHPAALVAIALLLLNDHFLKYLVPSWLTGKLSDFAGLFFTPYVCLAILALVSVGRLSRQRVELAMYFAIGILFTAIKTSADAAGVFVSVVSALTGQRISVVADPGDLIALVSLPLSYLILSRGGQQQPHLARRPLLRALTLCIATVAIAATSGPPPPSVTSIAVDRVDGNLLYAVVENTQDKDGLYVSSDGGAGWARISTMTGQVVADPAQTRTAYILDAPGSQSGLLRLRIGARPEEIGPGKRGVDTYLTDATSLSIGQWPSPVLFYVFHGVLWISDDGGVIWQNIGLGEPVHALATTPTPGLVFAATYGYLMRSIDGGRAWTHVIVLPGSGDVTALVAHRDDQQLLLAGIGKEIRRSTDGGLTWSPTIRYEGTTSLEFAHWTILLDPQDPDRAYALFGSGCCAPVISVDRGLTWKEWGDPLSRLAVTADRRSPLLGTDPFGTLLLRHAGTPPGTWDRVGAKLPLDR